MFGTGRTSYLVLGIFACENNLGTLYVLHAEAPHSSSWSADLNYTVGLWASSLTSRSLTLASSLISTRRESWFVMRLCEPPTSSPPRTSFEFQRTAGRTSGWVGCRGTRSLWFWAAVVVCHRLPSPPLLPGPDLPHFIQSHAAVSFSLGRWTNYFIENMGFLDVFLHVYSSD